LPKVVAPVHFAGNPVDLEYLGKLRDRYGFRVVEDAAQATGATFKGQGVGSCRWFDLCGFSFHAEKIITTGEEGVVTTNSRKFYEKLRRLRTHGISREKKHQSAHRTKPWYYEKLELGNHSRMTDFQAALGRSQLKKSRAFNMAREKVAVWYTEQLRQVSLDLPRLTKGARSSWHLYPVCVQGGEKQRNKVMGRLHRAGVMANLPYLPVPQFQFYKKRIGKIPAMPQAKKYARAEISLPIFLAMKKQAIQRVVAVLGKAIR
jgi:dTDP-4-amino-4,6-dideoxygalactose transaminase